MTQSKKVNENKKKIKNKKIGPRSLSCIPQIVIDTAQKDDVINDPGHPWVRTVRRRRLREKQFSGRLTFRRVRFLWKH